MAIVNDLAKQALKSKKRILREPLTNDEERIVDMIFEFQMLYGVCPTDKEMAYKIHASISWVRRRVMKAIEKGYLFRNRDKHRWTILVGGKK